MAGGEAAQQIKTYVFTDLVGSTRLTRLLARAGLAAPEGPSRLADSRRRCRRRRTGRESAGGRVPGRLPD